MLHKMSGSGKYQSKNVNSSSDNNSREQSSKYGKNGDGTNILEEITLYNSVAT